MDDLSVEVFVAERSQRCRRLIQQFRKSAVSMNELIQDINPSFFSKRCQELRCERGYKWSRNPKVH